MHKGKLQTKRDEAKALGISYTAKHTIKQLTTKIKKKEMENQTKEGNVSQEQIKTWKKEHKTVHVLKINVSDKDVAVGYLKKPSRNHKATALSMYSQNKVLEAGEFLKTNCWLGGDDRLLNNEDIADSASVQAAGIVKFHDGELGEA